MTVPAPRPDEGDTSEKRTCAMGHEVWSNGVATFHVDPVDDDRHDVGRMESPAREELARTYGECPHGNSERHCLACAVLPASGRSDDRD